jgi:transcriptional regulator with XRE-family HTH domain
MGRGAAGGYDPASVSTPATPRQFSRELRRWRDARHVSQLELALRAGTTQRHVSYVEQGRSVPGRTMVVRLAESLELSLRERNALLLAAGYAPVFPESRLDDEALHAAREALEGILVGHLPYPAVVVGPSGDLVAANAAIDVLIAGAAPALLEPPLNLLRLAVHPDGMAPRVENLAEWGRHILENVRARALRHPDERLDALAAEIEGYLPPPGLGSDHIGFAVPLRLRCEQGELQLMTTLTSFATALDVTLAELHLEAFLPANDASARILREREHARRERGGGSGPPPPAGLLFRTPDGGIASALAS